MLRYQTHVSQRRCGPLRLVCVFLQMFTGFFLQSVFKQQDQVVLDVFVWFDVLSAAVVWCFIPVLSILEVRRRLVHDDLDDKVLLDLGVLQAGLVCEELAGEEPALVGRVDVLLGLQLFLEQADGVGHAGAQTHVFAGGEPYFQLELFLLSGGGLGVVRQVFFASFGDQIDRRGQAINRELVTVSEFVVTLGQGSWKVHTAISDGEIKCDRQTEGWCVPSLLLFLCY